MKNKTQISLIPKPDFTGLGTVFDELSERMWKNFDIIASPFVGFADGHGFPFMGYTLWTNKDNEFVQEFEVPRFTKDDIKLSIEGDMLHINAEKDNKYKFYHTTNLPKNADTTKPSAKLEHGVLTISFPVKESAKAKTIEIK